MYVDYNEKRKWNKWKNRGQTQAEVEIQSGFFQKRIINVTTICDSNDTTILRKYKAG